VAVTGALEAGVLVTLAKGLPWEAEEEERRLLLLMAGDAGLQHNNNTSDRTAIHNITHHSTVAISLP